MTFPTLTTEQLILRQLLESDAQEIFLLRSDPEINKYLDRQPGKTLEDALDFIKKINESIKANNAFYWAITMSGNKKLVGTICLFYFSNDFNTCEIGYELLTEYQGHGIMLEAMKKVMDYAVDTLGVKKINALTHQDNQASIKLLKRFNFERTTIFDEENPNCVYFTWRK